MSMLAFSLRIERDVELAGLVHRHRFGDEQPPVGGAVVLQRGGRRDAVLRDELVGVELHRLDRRRLVDRRRGHVLAR